MYKFGLFLLHISYHKKETNLLKCTKNHTKIELETIVYERNKPFQCTICAFGFASINIEPTSKWKTLHLNGFLSSWTDFLWKSIKLQGRWKSWYLLSMISIFSSNKAYKKMEQLFLQSLQGNGFSNYWLIHLIHLSNQHQL